MFCSQVLFCARGLVCCVSWGGGKSYRVGRWAELGEEFGGRIRK